MMSTLSTVSSATSPSRRRHWSRAQRSRALLCFSTVFAIAAAASAGAGSAAGRVEPDLAILLRYMAVLKGAFAVVALGVCFWRLARPAAAWRSAVYIGSPGLMAGGAVCLWQMQSAGLAALALHVGMFALLAAALTDSDFIPGFRRGRSA